MKRLTKNGKEVMETEHKVGDTPTIRFYNPTTFEPEDRVVTITDVSPMERQYESTKYTADDGSGSTIIFFKRKL